jgi:ribonuclease BN (tRNA processing enzyme)
MLAAWAKVKHLRTFHYSPRYHDREHDLAEEAQAALLAHREATQA